MFPAWDDMPEMFLWGKYKFLLKYIRLQNFQETQPTGTDNQSKILEER